MRLSGWADTYRVLSREDSAAPGRWNTAARPYQRGIMDAVSDPRYDAVSVMGCAQWGKTQILGNVVGYYVHLDPAPIMVVQPTVETAEKWSKTRLSPMLRDTPVLRELVAEPKARDAGNTIREKVFPGGLLVIVGSNSPAGLASQPIRILCLDEVDRFEGNVGDEGDPVALAITRTIDFEGRRKIYACSTPTILGESRIQKRWELSDQRRFFVGCPHCGHRQFLRWEHVVWPEGQPERAFYACGGCGEAITDPQLRRAIRTGEWIATCPEARHHAGFHVPGMLVRALGALACEFLEARAEGIQAQQVFRNTRLGELWDPMDQERANAHELLGRREVYAAEVPMGGLILTAGIDVQDDRLELIVRAWGKGEESWLVRRRIIPGNLALDAPWDELEAELLRDYRHESGHALGLRLAAIDTRGHFTKRANVFTRRARIRGLVVPIAGATTRLKQPAQRSGRKARLWLLDTVTLKDLVFARLKTSEAGPSFMHFPLEDWCGRDYFEQLVSERPISKRQGGLQRRVYEPVLSGIRNEVLDCEVYAAGALEILAPRNLDDLAERLSTCVGGLEPGVKEPRLRRHRSRVVVSRCA